MDVGLTMIADFFILFMSSSFIMNKLAASMDHLEI
jgi:hypothetical protein